MVSRWLQKNKTKSEKVKISDSIFNEVELKTSTSPLESDYIQGSKIETLNIFGNTYLVEIYFRTYDIEGALETAKNNYRKLKSSINNQALRKQFKLELDKYTEINLDYTLNPSQLTQLRKTKIFPEELKWGWKGESWINKPGGGKFNMGTDSFYDMFEITSIKLGTSPQSDYDFAFQGELESDVEHGFSVKVKNGKIIGSGTASDLY